MTLKNNSKGVQIGELALGGSFVIAAQVKSSLAGGRVLVGEKGFCRYCGTDDLTKFRNVAHTFPESLGNKWVHSLDECDTCNERFSVYDDALANSLSPFLTLGGVKGKKSKIRQTGRSAGDSVINKTASTGPSQISIRVRGANPSEYFDIDPITKIVAIESPIAPVRFRPRYAYKSLVKMAIAIMPPEELQNFQKLRAWLNDVDDQIDFPHLEVGMSFTSIGNAPALAVGVLLRRARAKDVLPFMIFVFSAGSVCLQIYLMPDDLDDHLPLFGPNIMKICWSNVLDGDALQSQIRLCYGDPIPLDWASRELRSQPVESIRLIFDPATSQGKFIPTFRVDAA